jgi:hypothetical protein
MSRDGNEDEDEDEGDEVDMPVGHRVCAGRPGEERAVLPYVSAEALPVRLDHQRSE